MRKHYTTHLILGLLVFSTMLWCQSPANPGFEYANSLTTDWKNTPDIGSYTVIGARSNVTARTGSWSYLSATTTSTSFCRQINVSTLSIPANNYVHLIAWAKGINTDSKACLGGKLVSATGPDNNNGSSGLSTTNWTQLPAYNRQNTTAGALNFQCGLYIKSNTAGTSTQVYFDDVIVYTDNVAAADIISPTAATTSTSPETTGSSVTINWTNGTDAGTGVQNTIILRTTNMNAATPALNNQGVYSTAGGASGPNTVSTDWTVISTSVAAGATSFTDNTVNASTAYKYAVLHRDLAYNYSSALVITAITNLSTLVNASDLPPCSTCDIAVAAGGSFNVDNTQTYKSVTVAPGAGLTLSSGTLTVTNGITLESNENGTATITGSGTYSGTVTAKQYLGSARNWYVSSPVSSVSSPAANIDYYYEYLEAGNNDPQGQPGSPTAYWKGLTTAQPMEVGKGYIAKANTGTTIEFIGTPNNGDITTTFNLTRNDTKGKGFNLAGNPYPSYLDWSLLVAANPNLENTYYYRTKNTGSNYVFVTYNGAGSGSYVVSNGTANTTITRFIPPTQAFWVRVKSGVGATKMNFTNAMREHRDDSGNLMKMRKLDTLTSIRLQLQNGTESDEMLIYQDAGASNSYDAYDSPKMMNNSATIPDLYSKINDERLVINGLKTITENMEIPLGFSLNSAATLKFKLSELNNLPEGIKVYLRDKQENSETELTSETEYAFSTTATTNNESRFSLLFKAPGVTTGTFNMKKEQVSVFVNTQNHITIIARPNSNYAIYNAVGQMIENGTLNSELRTQNPKLAAGVYVVKVNNQSTRVVVK